MRRKSPHLLGLLLDWPHKWYKPGFSWELISCKIVLHSLGRMWMIKWHKHIKNIFLRLVAVKCCAGAARLPRLPLKRKEYLVGSGCHWAAIVCVSVCACSPVWTCAWMLKMFCVMPCLSGNNISIGFQGLIERFGRRLRGHMLIVPEKTCLFQKHIPPEFSLYTACQTSPSDKKKAWGSKAIHFILSFSKDAMLCFNLCRKGDERQCNKAKRSFCSYQMAFHSWPLRCHSRNWRQC